MSSQDTTAKPELAVHQIWTASQYLDWQRTRHILSVSTKWIGWVTYAGHHNCCSHKDFRKWIAKEQAQCSMYDPGPIWLYMPGEPVQRIER